MIRRLLLGVLVLLAGCHQAPPSHVALWAIGHDRQAQAYLLGAVHALPADTVWERPAISAALAKSDHLVLELADQPEPGAILALLRQMGAAPGMPPPQARLGATARTRLAALEQRLGLDDAQFAGVKTWVVAVELSASAAAAAGLDPATGVEARLRAERPGVPVAGLETAASQFAVFDQLPQPAQVALLEGVLDEAAGGGDDAALLGPWLRGDEAALTAATHRGLLRRPALYDALLAGRNRAWVGQLDVLLRRPGHPFIAVGAAHCLGPDGLVALLRQHGWQVWRVD